jgi:hypothetical protein
MVSRRPIGLGIDGLIIFFTQARLSMGSNVRCSVLTVTSKADAISAPQRYRGARSSRASTEGSVILAMCDGCHRGSSSRQKAHKCGLYSLYRRRLRKKKGVYWVS